MRLPLPESKESLSIINLLVSSLVIVYGLISSLFSLNTLRCTLLAKLGVKHEVIVNDFVIVCLHKKNDGDSSLSSQFKQIEIHKSRGKLY